MTYRELGRRVGLTSPAAAERVRRREERGIIRGYRAVVDHSKMCYEATALIRPALQSVRTGNS